MCVRVVEISTNLPMLSTQSAFADTTCKGPRTTFVICIVAANNKIG